MLGVSILGALDIGTGVGLRSLVEALPGDIFVTMSTQTGSLYVTSSAFSE